MDNSTIVTTAGAFFLPLIIAWLRGCGAPKSFAAIFAYFVVFLWTVLAWFLTDKLDWGANQPTLSAQVKVLLINLLAAAVTAFTAYRSLWQPIGATGQLEARGPQLGGGPST